MALDERTLSMTGQWAKTAQTSIPTPPIAGTAYRNSSLAVADIEGGQAYDKVFDSARYNQVLHQVTGLVQALEKHGILPYSKLTNYQQYAVCLGLDGTLYQAQQPSGPGGGGVQALSNATYWKSNPFGGSSSGTSGGSGTAELAAHIADTGAHAQIFQLLWNSKAPMPNSGTIMTLGPTGAGSTMTNSIPSGGSWFYYVVYFTSWTAGTGGQAIGISGGGSGIYMPGCTGQGFGFAWKIA